MRFRTLMVGVAALVFLAGCSSGSDGSPQLESTTTSAAASPLGAGRTPEMVAFVEQVTEVCSAPLKLPAGTELSDAIDYVRSAGSDLEAKLAAIRAIEPPAEEAEAVERIFIGRLEMAAQAFKDHEPRMIVAAEEGWDALMVEVRELNSVLEPVFPEADAAWLTANRLHVCGA